MMKMAILELELGIRNILLQHSMSYMLKFNSRQKYNKYTNLEGGDNVWIKTKSFNKSNVRSSTLEVKKTVIDKKSF